MVFDTTKFAVQYWKRRGNKRADGNWGWRWFPDVKEAERGASLYEEIELNMLKFQRWNPGLVLRIMPISVE